MFRKTIFYFIALFSIVWNNFSFANSEINSNYHDIFWRQHPFYFGLIGGFGSTDWSQLIPHCKLGEPMCNIDTKELLFNSAPRSAGDRGGIYGATLGYEIKPSWGLEANYIHFPTTAVEFAAASFYDPLRYMESYTWSLFAVAKFMTQIADTGFRGFANAGINFTGRTDIMTDTIRVGPTFGVGINYVFPAKVMVELGFQYMAGFGVCNAIPAKYYIPFLYAVDLKVVYRI